MCVGVWVYMCTCACVVIGFTSRCVCVERCTFKDGSKADNDDWVLVMDILKYTNINV